MTEILGTIDCILNFLSLPTSNAYVLGFRPLNHKVLNCALPFGASNIKEIKNISKSIKNLYSKYIAFDQLKGHLKVFNVTVVHLHTLFLIKKLVLVLVSSAILSSISNPERVLIDEPCGKQRGETKHMPWVRGWTFLRHS